MFRDKVFGFLKDLVDKVQEVNEKDENVETADTRVFDDLRKSVENTEREVDQRKQHAGMYDILRKEIEQNKVQNERSTEVETADTSVYDNMMREIEQLKRRIESQESSTTDTVTVPTVGETSEHSKGMDRTQMAMTNSMGGSLSIRLKPDFGSPKNTIRLPEGSLISVTEYSDHTINLNGADVRWAHIEFDGQRGWIPESYLNFN